MRFRPTNRPTLCAKRARGGFTLAEVLAALLFMAIVIPVAVEGLRIASAAGVVGERKAAAVRVAERVLNELLVTGQLTGSSLNGTVREGEIDYRWFTQTQPWDEDAMRVVTLQVVFTAQGREYDVNLRTLVGDSSI